MGIRGIGYVKRLFKSGNVCVTGLRGKGKDLLTANVVVRRRLPYISNVDYGGKYIPLDFEDLSCGHNTYKNFISGDVKSYVFPYPLGTDVYLSDGGIYLPSQYCNELNRDFPYLATYSGLSRHTSRANFHVNTQSLNRIYDKLREQSDTYIRCVSCHYIFGFVIQRIIVYDKYQSCVDRVKPCRIRVPLSNANAKATIRTYKDKFEQDYGYVKSHLLIYRNKSKYDTHHFYNLLKGDLNDEDKT